MVKELPPRKKTIRQNQPMRLRYTHYNSRSAVKVGPQTHVLSYYFNLDWTLTKPFSIVQALGKRLIYSLSNAPYATLFQSQGTLDILF